MDYSKHEVALVTGATSGIGAATAIELGRRGAVVGLIGRNQAAGERVAEQVLAVGGQAILLPTDVTSLAEIEQAVAALLEQCGHLDTVVSNAGIAVGGNVVDMQVADWHRMIDVNLNGTFYLARATMPHLVARGRGAFVAVSSDAGVQGAQGFAGYCASKHAVNGLVRCLALDYGAKGVRSNAVCPSFVQTPMADRLLAGASEAEQSYYRSVIPLNRFARPEEVAAVIAHLTSSAGSYTNGLMYCLDGGETAGLYMAQA
jgi:meso-butanediol dehydrogenase / (S,S)-butanediol dehydrogenase / diacetyl reductase